MYIYNTTPKKMLKINVYKHIKDWHMRWGGFRMSNEFSSRRPAYTNSEIVSMFNKKFSENADSYTDLAKRYDTEEKTIKLMSDITCRYNYEMLKIASDYLEISYKDLVAIIEDDENNYSLRANSTEAAKELNEILNYLFNEMINQERIAMA